MRSSGASLAASSSASPMTTRTLGELAVRSRAIPASAGEMSQAVIAASGQALATAMVVDPGPQPISNPLKGLGGAQAVMTDNSGDDSPSSAKSVSLQRSAQTSPLLVAHSGDGTALVLSDIMHRSRTADRCSPAAG